MAAQDLRSKWTDIDRAADPGRCVRYLDTASATEGARVYKTTILELLDIRAGGRVLDVGCGTGDDVRIMARLADRTGRVVGVDYSTVMIAEASRRSEGQELPVEFQVTDAHSLPFPDNTFDCCRADRTFQHLEDPTRGLAEMVRVAQPRARIVVADPDYDTVVVDSPNRELTRKVLNHGCDAVRNGWMGRHLYALFKAAGLADVVVVPVAIVSTDHHLVDEIIALRTTAEGMRDAGEISADDARNWLEQMERAGQEGYFLAALTVFIVAGRKP